MENYQEIDKESLPGDTYLDDITASHLVIFCNFLFPGADFVYWRTRSKNHHFAYYPNAKRDHGVAHKALWIEIDKNLISFKVSEYNDIPHSNCRDGFSETLKYNKLCMYNVFKAYTYLESVGAIEHHVVDDLLNKPFAVEKYKEDAA